MLIAGVDEAGRGPWAGPVVAAAVILREPIEGVRDSKLLTANRRARLAAELRQRAWIGVGAASVKEIDRLDIRRASLLAMRRAVGRLPVRPERVLVDGRDRLELEMACEAVIGGDRTHQAIGAASIIAKTVRDRLMSRLAARYRAYGFERNKGYGTAEHQAALLAAGVTAHHRRSFKPVIKALEGRA